MQPSWYVQVGSTDIGSLDHSLGIRYRTARFVKKQKRRLRKGWVERLKEDNVRQILWESLEGVVKDFE